MNERNLVRKSQLQRIANIVFILQSKPHTKTEIINKLFLKFEQEFSRSQIEKDLFCLQIDFDAPIEYIRFLKKYQIDKKYDFKESLFQYVSI
jgi:hypothetical protein